MRLLAITPIVVDDAELARRQARYDALAPAGVTVVLEHLDPGSSGSSGGGPTGEPDGQTPRLPRALDTADDVRASERALHARYAAVDPTGWDAYLPDCVLDPLADLAEADGEGAEGEGLAGLARPVLGLGRLTAAFVTGQGARLGAVARNAPIAAELDRRLGQYAAATVAPTAVLDLSVDDIADDATWAAAVERAVEDLDCDFVLNACSAVDVAEQARAPYVLDPTATALALLGLRARVTGRLDDPAPATTTGTVTTGATR